MAERKWTARQLEAIEADGTLTVLSAAAGSGKTTVLVEKALRILLDEQNRTPADRLLIVTFSNASAKEFKNRIEKGRHKKCKKRKSLKSNTTGGIHYTGSQHRRQGADQPIQGQRTGIHDIK